MNEFKPGEWHYYPKQAEYYETWLYVIKAKPGERLNSIIFWFSGPVTPVYLGVTENECPTKRWDPQKATSSSLRELIKLTFDVKIHDSRKR